MGGVRSMRRPRRGRAAWARLGALSVLCATVVAVTAAAAGCSGSNPPRPAPAASGRSAAGTVSGVRLDGPVYGRPADGGDRVFAATENNTVYALSPTDGSVMWSK